LTGIGVVGLHGQHVVNHAASENKQEPDFVTTHLQNIQANHVLGLIRAINLVNWLHVALVSNIRPDESLKMVLTKSYEWSLTYRLKRSDFTHQ
jgi:hypothetical protein